MHAHIAGPTRRSTPNRPYTASRTPTTIPRRYSVPKPRPDVAPGLPAVTPGIREVLSADFAANRHDPKGLMLVMAFRLAAEASRLARLSPAVRLAMLPILVTYRVLVAWVLGFELPSGTTVGPGLRVRHGQGVVVNPGTVLGSNIMLRQGVTIGNIKRRRGLTPCPVVGDGVEFGANAIVLGEISIGAGAMIGAGCVVTTDVPAGALVRPPRPEIVDRAKT